MQLIRDLLAITFFISGFCYIRMCILRRSSTLVRVVLVHHIKTTMGLERMLRYYSQSCNPVSWDDVENNQLDRKKINIVFTMDDGYGSWLDKGLPLFEKYSVPCLMFIPSGFIEGIDFESYCRVNMKLPFVSKPLSWGQLQKLEQSPLITCGGHTVSHPFLTQLDQAEQIQEITTDKKHIESKLNRQVNCFAYPFGDYNSQVQSATRQAGYNYAFTCRGGWYDRTVTDSWDIPRTNHGTVSVPLLMLYTWGAYDLVAFCERLVRRVVNRSMRMGQHLI